MPSSAINSGPGCALLPAAPQVSPAAALLRFASLSGGVASYDLPTKARHIPNQKKVPCCVSCALGAAMEILDPDLPKLAPLFHYYLTRSLRGVADGRGALYLNDAFRVLESHGICRLELHPYAFTMAEAQCPPSQKALEDGIKQRLEPGSRYCPRIGSIKTDSRALDICNHLKKNNPVVLNFVLPEGFEEFIKKKKEWTDLQAVVPSGLGHCVVVVGYNDARGLKIQDSQGEDFADSGYWWMGYPVVDSPFVHEAYYLTAKTCWLNMRIEELIQ